MRKREEFVIVVLVIVRVEGDGDDWVADLVVVSLALDEVLKRTVDRLIFGLSDVQSRTFRRVVIGNLGIFVIFRFGAALIIKYIG